MTTDKSCAANIKMLYPFELSIEPELKMSTPLLRVVKTVLFISIQLFHLNLITCPSVPYGVGNPGYGGDAYHAATSQSTPVYE